MTRGFDGGNHSAALEGVWLGTPQDEQPEVYYDAQEGPEPHWHDREEYEDPSGASDTRLDAANANGKPLVRGVDGLAPATRSANAIRAWSGAVSAQGSADVVSAKANADGQGEAQGRGPAARECSAGARRAAQSIWASSISACRERRRISACR